MKYYYAIIDGIMQMLKIDKNIYSKEVLKAKNILKVTKDDYAVKNLFNENGIRSISMFNNEKHEKAKIYLDVLCAYCTKAAKVYEEKKWIRYQDLANIKNDNKRIIYSQTDEPEEIMEAKIKANIELFNAILKNLVREKIDEEFK